MTAESMARSYASDTPRDPAARYDRVVHLSFRPLEGVGNAGCPLHPQPRVRFALVKSTRVNEYTGITRRSRTQWFYSLCRALPGDRALLPPSSTDMVLSKPGWADLTSANLTPASGRQDHTILLSAATSFVSSRFDRSQASSTRPASRCASNAAASTASRPASVTIMIRPSSGVGWRKF
jgi:hypothetical protein